MAGAYTTRLALPMDACSGNRFRNSRDPRYSIEINISKACALLSYQRAPPCQVTLGVICPTMAMLNITTVCKLLVSVTRPFSL